jgi:hypothetical protein
MAMGMAGAFVFPRISLAMESSILTWPILLEIFFSWDDWVGTLAQHQYRTPPGLCLLKGTGLKGF